jgi:hypothetical protein
LILKDYKIIKKGVRIQLFTTIKSDFVKQFSDLGCSLTSNYNDLYILHLYSDVSDIIKIQLNCSDSVDERKYGSQNGNIIEALGLFKFKYNPATRELNFIVFGFLNSIKQRTEYIIIPTDELYRRLTNDYGFLKRNHTYKLIFWLMSDGFLYNCSDIGLEGEWYFLSKGLNGRLIDETGWNYTAFLNGWDELVRK